MTASVSPSSPKPLDARPPRDRSRGNRKPRVRGTQRNGNNTDTGLSSALHWYHCYCSGGEKTLLVVAVVDKRYQSLYSRQYSHALHHRHLRQTRKRGNVLIHRDPSDGNSAANSHEQSSRRFQPPVSAMMTMRVGGAVRAVKRRRLNARAGRGFAACTVRIRSF